MERVYLCIVRHERAEVVPYRVVYAAHTPAPTAPTTAPCPRPVIAPVLTPVLSSIPTKVIMAYTWMSASRATRKRKVTDSVAFAWDTMCFIESFSLQVFAGQGT